MGRTPADSFYVATVPAPKRETCRFRIARECLLRRMMASQHRLALQARHSRWATGTEWCPAPSTL